MFTYSSTLTLKLPLSLQLPGSRDSFSVHLAVGSSISIHRYPVASRNKKALPKLLLEFSHPSQFLAGLKSFDRLVDPKQDRGQLPHPSLKIRSVSRQH